ncbi:MAG: DUF2339 domain-containing protein [Rhodothermales bacterium]|nr:DUF2339 domain-containing protein [Rhodothermales bacterium]MBO6781226.1 DUF2339 domain-containing protein [Rhodothermales bacterium]
MDQESRIADLEARVAALEERLANRVAPASPTPRPKPPDRLREAGARLVAFLTGDGALARLGMLLFLAGILFLVRYGIERGWINELVRVALAVVAGGVLLALAGRLRERRMLAHVLAGGGVGAWYVAVFSAHVFYGMIGLIPALVLATAVSGVCLALSLVGGAGALASVAFGAATAAPFVLSGGEGSLVALTVYLAAVMVTAGIVYRSRGWVLTHALLAAGMTVALALAAGELRPEHTLAVRSTVTGAILVFFGVFGVLPMMWCDERRWAHAITTLQAIGVPLLTLGLLMIALDLSRLPVGWLALAGAAGYSAVSIREGRNLLFRAGPLSAAALLASVGSLALLDGESFGPLLILAAVLHVVHARYPAEAAGWVARLLVLVGSVGMALQLLDGTSIWWQGVVFDGLGIIALPAVASATAEAGRHYAIAWVLGLLYLNAVFGALGDYLDIGPVLATIAWALLAVTLLATGFRLRERIVRLAGISTVGLVVGKLLFFDLEQMDAVWRILLFLGIGAALLGASYLFPDFWEEDLEESPVAEQP